MKSIKFKTSLSVCIPYGLPLEKAHRFINKHFYGKESVPLDADVSQEHKDAAHNICGHHIIGIIITLNEDGTMNFEIDKGK